MCRQKAKNCPTSICFHSSNRLYPTQWHTPTRSRASRTLIGSQLSSPPIAQLTWTVIRTPFFTLGRVRRRNRRDHTRRGHRKRVADSAGGNAPRELVWPSCVSACLSWACAQSHLKIHPFFFWALTMLYSYIPHTPFFLALNLFSTLTTSSTIKRIKYGEGISDRRNYRRVSF